MLRRALCLGAILGFLCTIASAAPRVTNVVNGSPAHGQIGKKMVFQAEGLVAPVRVFFSDGASPTVETTPVQFDAGRGFLIAQVPAGAQTGNLKVTSNGVDSPPYYFRIDSGSFLPGSGVVQGVVSGPGGPVAGAMIALLVPGPCDGEDLVDVVLSGSLGEYSLQGPPGDVLLFVFPPVASGLAAGGMPATLGASPTTVDVPLSGATVVNGRVVRASGGSGVANARLEFEGDAGFDTRLTDASGNFSVVLPEGNSDIRVNPPVADALTRSEQSVSIGSSSPQTLSSFALGGGVRIFGTVRRATGGTPLANVSVGAWSSTFCCGNLDENVSAGDGTFAVVVPAGDTYQISTRIDDDAPLADASVSSIVVGATDVQQDLALEDAGAIAGIVLDASTATPIPDLTVQALSVPYQGNSVAFTRTCQDGSYRLRVPPSASGYIALAGYGESSGYVPVAWNNASSGTFFPCEGMAIAVAGAGTVVGGIGFELPSGAAAISGSVRSQSSGCTATVSGTFWMTVDDGMSHACGLGWSDFGLLPGTYRVHGLPASDLVPGLRVCYPGSGAESPQCWNVKRPPGYEPVFASPGGEASGTDFCLGSSPVSAVSGVWASKSGGSVTFSWTSTDDPYQSQYRLRGSLTAKPTSAPGSFPSDPVFDTVWTGMGSSASVPTSLPYSFFLVTNVGISGTDGPSGSYAP